MNVVLRKNKFRKFNVSIEAEHELKNVHSIFMLAVKWEEKNVRSDSL